MHTRRRFLSLSAGSFLAAVAGSSALTACDTASGGDAAAGGTPRPGGTLTFAEPTSPIGWDPHVGTEDVLGLILRPVFDSLVAADAAGVLTPWLAKAWTVSPDGLTYTFDLRDDVTFSDGTKFDAQAVKDNFDHVVAPATKSRYAKSLIGPYAGTDVLAPDKVAVKLSRPYSQFLHAVSSTWLGFHSPKALKEHAADLGSGGAFIVSTGPYTFDSVVQGQRAVFQRRPGYAWAPSTAKHPGESYLDGYTVLFTVDDQARVGAATSGQIDIADQVPPQQLPALRGRSGVTVVSRDSPGSPYTYYLNTRRPLLQNVDARRAILSGVDIAAITQGLFQGQYQRADAPLSSSTRGYTPDIGKTWGYDRAKAESLLDGLGYTARDGQGYRTKDGQRFTLRFPFATANTTKARRSFDTAFQDALKQLGIELVLTEQDAASYIKQQQAGDYDVSGLFWGGADPSVLWNLYSSQNLLPQGGANKAWVTDPQVDALLDAAEKTTDVNQQNSLYQQVQARVIDQAYGLPTYVEKRSLAVRDRVHGFSFDSAGWPFVREIWVSGT